MMNLFLPFTDDKDLLLLSIFNDFLINNQSKLLYEDCKIYAIYGTPAGAIWNGGRAMALYLPRWNYNQIRERVNYFNQRNINVHLTFTNNLLESEHLNDNYCNMILDAVDNGHPNCVIVASDILKNYIKETHPGLKLSASIVLGNSLDLVQQRIYDYDYVVCYKKRNVLDYLNTLPLKFMDKIEVILTECCANCPHPLAHATYDSQSNLKQDFEKLFKCYYDTHENKKLPIENPNALMPIENCFNMGINKFKVSGRGENVRSNLLTWIMLFVKEEYRNEVFEELWKKYITSDQLF